MSKQLDEMRERRDQLAATAHTLLEDDQSDPAELERVNSELEKVGKRIEWLETALDELAAHPERVQPGDPGLAADRDPKTFSFRRGVKPWDDADTVMRSQESQAERRDRGLAAVELVQGELLADRDRERLERIVRGDATGTNSDYLRATSDPAYSRAFFKLLKNPTHGGLSFTVDEQRAFAKAEEVRTAVTTTTGSALLPVMIDPTILLSSNGAIGDFRSFCATVQVPVGTWHGVSSAGVSAEWVGEAVEATDASPSFSQPTIRAERVDVYVEASLEAYQDSNLSEQLGELFSDALRTTEADKFTRGTGTSEPTGVVTTLIATTASRVASTTNGLFGAIDLFKMTEALPGRYMQRGPGWLAHIFLYNLTRQFGGNNQPNFWVDLGPAVPGQLLGFNAYQSSYVLNAGGTTGLSAATASTDSILVLGDWSRYLIVDRLGSTVQFLPVVTGANRRPTGSVGWFFVARIGGGVTVANAFRLLQC